MSNELKEFKPVMMNGTDSKQSYLLFARRGNVALGIKPNAIMDGQIFGVPGTTYIGARLRSAPGANALLEDKAQEATNVAKFGGDFALDNAWPDVTFEKVDQQRASTQVCVFLRGTIENDIDKLVEELDNKKLAKKMAAYLVSLAGPDNMVITERELRDWLHDKFAPALEGMQKKSQALGKVKEAVEDSIGSFGMQTKLFADLKKMIDPTAAEDLETLASSGSAVISLFAANQKAEQPNEDGDGFEDNDADEDGPADQSHGEYDPNSK